MKIITIVLRILLCLVYGGYIGFYLYIIISSDIDAIIKAHMEPSSLSWSVTLYFLLSLFSLFSLTIDFLGRPKIFQADTLDQSVVDVTESNKKSFTWIHLTTYLPLGVFLFHFIREKEEFETVIFVLLLGIFSMVVLMQLMYFFFQRMLNST